MQSTGQRALSTLASKLHPQLPLTPRESQQLLQLLTTSFRTHLDREHPVKPPENRSRAPSHAATTVRIASSHGLAAQHIDSILTNPLFAHKPKRRGSDFAAADIIKDPLAWFLDQVATGNADISKASICLEILKLVKTTAKRKPASLIAEWLQMSGLDTSREFLEKLVLAPRIRGPISCAVPIPKMIDRGPFHSLVPMLLSEGNQTPLWRWFTRETTQRMEETGMDVDQVQAFRALLLSNMTGAALATSLDSAFAIFLRAHNMAMKGDYGLAPAALRHAGFRLANATVYWQEPAKPVECSSELYDSFLLASSDWDNSFSKAIHAMLHLRHPTKATAQPGLSFIKDPKGALYQVNSKLPIRKKNFLVRLSLGVARQLLAEERFADAQFVMSFTKHHFAEIVLKSMPTPRGELPPPTETEMKHNLSLLDRLLPT